MHFGKKLFALAGSLLLGAAINAEGAPPAAPATDPTPQTIELRNALAATMDEFRQRIMENKELAAAIRAQPEEWKRQEAPMTLGLFFHVGWSYSRAVQFVTPPPPPSGQGEPQQPMRLVYPPGAMSIGVYATNHPVKRSSTNHCVITTPQGPLHLGYELKMSPAEQSTQLKLQALVEEIFQEITREFVEARGLPRSAVRTYSPRPPPAPGLAAPSPPAGAAETPPVEEG